MNTNELGLPAERTVLAWNRTALAAVGLAALMIRVVISAFPIAGAVAVGLLLGVAGVVCGVVCARRATRLRHLGTRAGALSPRAAAVVVTAVALIGVAAFVIGVTRHGTFVG